MRPRAIFGSEDDGAALGGNAARAEAAKRALGGDAADGLGALEQLGRARGGVPEVALHGAAGVLRDGGDGEAAVAAAVLAGEAARVHHEAMQGAGVEVRAGGVLDARVVCQRRGFAAAGDVDALGGRDRVDVIEVECERGDVVGAEGFAVG